MHVTHRISWTAPDMPQMMPQTSGVSGNDFWTLGTGTGIAEHIPKYWEWEWKIANYMLNSRSRKHIFFEHRSAVLKRGTGGGAWTLQVLQPTWKSWVGEPDYLDPNLLQEQPLANCKLLPTFSEVKMSWILFWRKDQWLLLMATLAGSCSTCWPACSTSLYYISFYLGWLFVSFGPKKNSHLPLGKNWSPMQHPF